MSPDDPIHFGRFQLLERIAQGSLAEVYRAKVQGVEGFEKVVALKRLLPELADDQPFVDLYLREARLSVALTHAHVVQVFDLGREEGTYYVAAEFVRGTSLEVLIDLARRRGMAVPLELAVFIGAGVARALDYAHRRKDAHGKLLGVLHRDVTPRNVLISAEGEVKVGDFGVGAARDLLESRSGVPSHVASRAPEQLSGGVEDVRTDLYGLGVTLFTTLAGRNPFVDPTSRDAPDTAGLREAVLSGRAASLRELRPDVPEELAAVIERAMRVDPSQRWPTASEVFETLTTLLYGFGKRIGSNDLGAWLRLSASLPSVPPLAPGVDDAEIELVEEEIGALEDDSVGFEDIVEIEGPALEIEPPAVDIELSVSLSPDDDPSRPWDELHDVALMVFRGETGGAAALDRVVEPLASEGGVILEREGSEALAVLGAAVPDAGDPERALLLALRLAADLGLSVGVHPARVKVDPEGTVYRDARYAEAIAAARGLFARYVEPGAVVVGEGIGASVEEEFLFGPMMQGIRKVRGHRTDVRRKAIGRKEQFRQVAELLTRATANGAQALTVRGGEGSGKTRFLEEVQYRLRRLNHPVGWHSARLHAAIRDEPFGGMRAMLAAVLGVDPAEPESHTREKASKLREFGLTPDEMLALGSLLGVVTSGEGAWASNERALRSGFARAVGAVSRDQLTVLVWDGADRLDAATEHSVGQLLASAVTSKVVLVGAARPGRTFPWEGSPRHLRVDVGAFDDEELRQVIALRLGAASIPSTMVAALWARSEGVPLAVDAQLRQWRLDGTVTVEAGVARFDRTRADGPVPRRVSAALVGGVAALPDIARRVLQVAAEVSGTRFGALGVARAAGVDAQEARTALAVAVARGVVALEGERYRFVPGLRAEALREALPDEVRRAVLRAASQAPVDVEELSPEALDAQVRSWLVEGERQGAIARLEHIGEAAAMAGQQQLAFAAHARAIELAEDDRSESTERTFERYLAAAEAAVRGPEVDLGVALLRKGVALAEQADANAVIVVLLTRLGRLLGRVCAPVEAVRVLERAGAIAEKIARRDLRAAAHATAAMVQADRGEYTRAARVLGDSVAMLADASRPEDLALARTAAARVQFAASRLDDCGALVLAAQAAEAVASDPSLAIELGRIQAELHRARRDLVGARALAQGVALRAVEVDPGGGWCAVSLLDGELALALGDLEGMRSVVAEVREVAQAKALRRFELRANALGSLADLRDADIPFDPTREAVERIAVALEGDGFAGDANDLRRMLGAEVAPTDPDRARRILREARMKAGATDNKQLAEQCDWAMREISMLPPAPY